MIRDVRTFLIVLVLTRVAVPQTPEELAQIAARAMQQQDYATAEKVYRQFLQLAPNIVEIYSNLGLACYSQNKFPCAEEAFTHALKLAPDLFVPNFLLGKIYFQQGRYQAAIGVLRKALSVQPENKEARKVYIATLVGLKRYDQAIQEYDHALKKDPNSVDTYFGLGNVYLEIGQRVIEHLVSVPGYPALLKAQHYEPFEEWRSLALDAYREAITSLPSIPGVRLGYARLEIAEKNWTAAEKALRDELHVDPESYEARFQLACVALTQGATEDALQKLEEAVHIRPEFFRPLPVLDPEWTPAGRAATASACARHRPGFATFYVLFAIAEASGHSGEVGEWAAKAEAARDEISAALQNQMSLEKVQSAGLYLLEHKRYEQGLNILLAHVRRTELDENCKLQVARALHALGRHEEMTRFFGSSHAIQNSETNYLLGLSYKDVAFKKLTHMVQLAPESARAHQVLGDAYFAEQRFGDAAVEYEAAVKLEPQNHELHFQLGNIYFKRSQFSLALQSFDRTLQLDPLNAEAYLMRGDALVQLEEVQEALAPLKKSLELNPELTRAHVLLGKVYTAQGNLAEAVKHMEKGAATDKDCSVHYQLSVLYRKLNQPEKADAAIRVCRKVSNIQP